MTDEEIEKEIDEHYKRINQLKNLQISNAIKDMDYDGKYFKSDMYGYIRVEDSQAYKSKENTEGEAAFLIVLWGENFSFFFSDYKHENSLHYDSYRCLEIKYHHLDLVEITKEEYESKRTEMLEKLRKHLEKQSKETEDERD